MLLDVHSLLVGKGKNNHFVIFTAGTNFLLKTSEFKYVNSMKMAFSPNKNINAWFFQKKKITEWYYSVWTAFLLWKLIWVCPNSNSQEFQLQQKQYSQLWKKKLVWIVNWFLKNINSKLTFTTRLELCYCFFKRQYEY